MSLFRFGWFIRIRTSPFLEFNEPGEPVVYNANLVFVSLYKLMQPKMLSLIEPFAKIPNHLMVSSASAAWYLSLWYISDTVITLYHEVPE